MTKIIPYESTHQNGIDEMMCEIALEFKKQIFSKTIIETPIVPDNYWVAVNNDRVVGTVGILIIENNFGILKKMMLKKEFRAKEFSVFATSFKATTFPDGVLSLGNLKTLDYKSMGLKTLKNSLHYPQKDGYVHAIDLHTNNRSEFRNRLLKYYFMLMGFHTLRYVGTADHLHISLPIEENPNAI
ncbi:MAG: hypothetical protein ACI85I_002605 [Arenicella sp.]|jgi:hypothetical protein